jgi:hypothetical protein
MEAILYTGRNCHDVLRFAGEPINDDKDACGCSGEEPLFIGINVEVNDYLNAWATPGDIVLRTDRDTLKVVRGQGWW